MPTLRQSSDDGHYFVRLQNPFLDINTWQIDREGFDFLQAHGICLDASFSLDLFMTMYRRRLVYYGLNSKEYWKDRVHLVDAAVFPPALLAAFRDNFVDSFIEALNRVDLTTRKPKITREEPAAAENPGKLYSLITPPDPAHQGQQHSSDIREQRTQRIGKLGTGIPTAWTNPNPWEKKNAKYVLEVFVNGALVRSVFLPRGFDESNAMRFASAQVRGTVRRCVVQLWRISGGEKTQWVDAWVVRRRGC